MPLWPTLYTGAGTRILLLLHCEFEVSRSLICGKPIQKCCAWSKVRCSIYKMALHVQVRCDSKQNHEDGSRNCDRDSGS